MSHQSVIDFARKSHTKHWRMSGDAGTGDKLAASITADWQENVLSKHPGRYSAEQRIADHLGERIDLVNLENGVAYELKVSPNNDHFEFYRDIFKVLIARDNLIPQLSSFCFICPEKAALRYNRGLRKAVLDQGDKLGLKIFVEAI